MMNTRFLIGLSVAIVLLTLNLYGCSMSRTGSAMIYEKKGDYSTAIKYYEEAADMESRQMQKMTIYMRLARMYAQMGQFDTAGDRLENVLTIISDLPEEVVRIVLPETDAEYCLALNALEKGNYKRCISLSENMLLTEDMPNVHYYLSIAYRRQAEEYSRGESVPHLKNLTTPSPEFRDAIDLINQGSDLANAGDPKGAVAKFDLALDRVPTDNPTQDSYEKGLLMLKKGDYAKAIGLFRDMSETADVNHYLGSAYKEQARVSAQKAIEWLEAGKKETQGNVSVLYEEALNAVRGGL